jgi:hypothetical protein
MFIPSINAMSISTDVMLVSSPDLDPMSSSSFQPQPIPGQPMVVPLNGRVEVKCLPPRGLPTPTTRLVAKLVARRRHRTVAALHQNAAGLSVERFSRRFLVAFNQL